MVLEPGGGQSILTAAETLHWLGVWLAAMDAPPADLAALAGPRERALRLLETACELETAPGLRIQWYAVRLEPPARPAGPEG